EASRRQTARGRELQMLTMTSDNDHETPEDELLAEARRWVVRMRSGNVTPVDLDALTRWRDTSPAHRRALSEATAQWDTLRLLAKASVASGGLGARRGRSAFGSPMTRRAWLGGAMAASVGGAVYLAARPPLDLWPSLAELRADYRTAVGEQRK